MADWLPDVTNGDNKRPIAEVLGVTDEEVERVKVLLALLNNEYDNVHPMIARATLHGYEVATVCAVGADEHDPDHDFMEVVAVVVNASMQEHLQPPEGVVEV